MIGEKLDLSDADRNFSSLAQLPQPLDRAVNRRGTDGATGYRQQVVGRHAMVAHGKIRPALHLHARAVAIIPGVSGMSLDLTFPLELGVALQRFPQDAAFDLQLRLVAGVLVMAAAAVGKVLALGLNPVRRSLE